MLSPKIHRYIFLFGVYSLAFGMMLGTVPTSVPILILLGNWILEMDFKRKWLQLKSNKLFWVISSLFLVHALGLLYTEDINAGINDVRTKSPIMLLALIFFSSSPLSVKEFHVALYCFLAGSFCNTCWSYIYTFMLHKNEVVRSASRFMSHIRLGLYLNVAIACCVYFIFNHKASLKKLAFTLLIFYFVFCMYALGLASGLANFCILSFLIVCYFAFKQGFTLSFILASALFGAFYLLANYISNIHSQQFTLNKSEINSKLSITNNGKTYYHFEDSTQTENGNLVQRNIQLTQLYNEWNRLCPNDTFSYAHKVNMERFQVLIRYMSSLGLRKDSAGLHTLSKQDLINVQNNITNYQMPEWSYFHQRIYELVNEYEDFKNNRAVNGHSLGMRLYFWKAAIHVIKNNVLFGIGTGDVQSELNIAYIETKTPLSTEWYKRPHNQFLTVTVALGIFGLIVFIFSLIYPLIILRKKLHLLYWPFFIMAVISFLIEDTLETQAGLTFFAFFNVLFVSMAYFNHRDIEGTEFRGE